MHYLLFYEVADDYVARRAPYRNQHLEKAWQASDRGDLVLAGALANPVDGAVLLFSGDSPAVAENFARTDPYVTSGAVKRWYVREWTTVVGQDAATPVEPAGRTTSEVRSAPERGEMIMRMWRGRCAPDKAGDYAQHALQKVFPALQQIEGHRGAYLLRRALPGAIEFVVLTLWDSMAAVSRFAGPEPDRAVVEPEAQAVLASFDKVMTHFEIVHAPEAPGP
ncbi:MAG TPA: YciI-like protein [Gemmataceae bacterium]|nr:YciI-like protein [Gemmataceae bacterium]